jgi:hypothetical protein
VATGVFRLANIMTESEPRKRYRRADDGMKWKPDVSGDGTHPSHFNLQ